MKPSTRLLLCFVFTVLVAVGSVPAAGGGEPVAPCDPRLPRRFDLVAPPSLPTGYRSGFYLVATIQRPTSEAHQPATAVVEPATPAGRLRYRYRRQVPDRRDGRFPLRFAPGDGGARVSVSYLENHTQPNGNRTECLRTLAATVRHERMAPSHLRVRHAFRRGSRMHVSGTIRRSARRPILVRVYASIFFRAGRRTYARNGRWAVSISVYRFRQTHLPRWDQYPTFTARAFYPGDVRESWPCDDVFSSGPDDGCLRRVPHPPT